MKSVAGLTSPAARLEEIARLLAIPPAAFGDPASCELGQTAELLRLWHVIDDPRARARVITALRRAAGRYGAMAGRAEAEPDPVA